MKLLPPAPWLDRELYPFQPQRFSTKDGDLSFVDEGRGAPVLLVHGTPSWSFEWRAVIRALAKDHRVVAPDHLGFGLSDKPSDPSAPLAPADHAHRLRALVEALDLRDVTLVVHDFGGPIGLPLALDLPERIARVIVVNSWMWPNADDPQVVKLDRMIRSFVGRFLYRWLNFSPRVLVPASFGEKKKLSKAAHRHYLAPFGARRDREAPYALARALLGSDAHYATLWARRDELAPKLAAIVWGEKDPAFGAKHLARWCEAFPKVRVVKLPEAGHFVAEEDPEAIVRAVRACES
jgi:haloalkane dehalogenase